MLRLRLEILWNNMNILKFSNFVSSVFHFLKLVLIALKWFINYWIFPTNFIWIHFIIELKIKVLNVFYAEKLWNFEKSVRYRWIFNEAETIPIMRYFSIVSHDLSFRGQIVSSHVFCAAVVTDPSNPLGWFPETTTLNI